MLKIRKLIVRYGLQMKWPERTRKDWINKSYVYLSSFLCRQHARWGHKVVLMCHCVPTVWLIRHIQRSLDWTRSERPYFWCLTKSVKCVVQAWPLTVRSSLFAYTFYWYLPDDLNKTQIWSLIFFWLQSVLIRLKACFAGVWGWHVAEAASALCSGLTECFFCWRVPEETKDLEVTG